MRYYPVTNESAEFRRAYCTGIAMMAGVENGVNEAEREAMLALAGAMALEESEILNILGRLGTFQEHDLQWVVSLLDTAEKQGFFVMDLFRMAISDGRISPAEEKALRIYFTILHIPERLCTLYTRFAISLHAGAAVDSLRNIIRKARQGRYAAAVSVMEYYLEQQPPETHG